jgi:hypothetical protein
MTHNASDGGADLPTHPYLSDFAMMNKRKLAKSTLDKYTYQLAARIGRAGGHTFTTASPPCSTPTSKSVGQVSPSTALDDPRAMKAPHKGRARGR